MLFRSRNEHNTVCSFLVISNSFKNYVLMMANCVPSGKKFKPTRLIWGTPKSTSISSIFDEAHGRSHRGSWGELKLPYLSIDGLSSS